MLSHGKNILNTNKYNFVKNRALETQNGTMYITSSGNWYGIPDYIPLSNFKDGDYLIASPRSTICYYNDSKNFLNYSDTNHKITIPINAKYYRIDTHKDYLNIYQLEIGENLTSYDSYKEHKIEILLPEPLRSLDNVCDTIEQREDGVYLIQRIKQMRLSGFENWTMIDIDAAQTSKYFFIT